MFAVSDLRKARPISLFGLARKEKRFLDSKEKRAPNARNPCTARKPGIAIVERGTAPGAKTMPAHTAVRESSLALAPLPGSKPYHVPSAPGGIQRGIRRSPLAVSIREGQGRARCVANVPVARLQPKRGASCACDQGQRIRNLPLLSCVSFATFLWPTKEKLRRNPCPAITRERKHENRRNLFCRAPS